MNKKLALALGTFATILLLASLIPAMPSSDYNAKKLGWWKLQFSGKGNFDKKIPENDRKRIVAEIAPYFNITEPFFFTYPRNVLHLSHPLTEEEKTLQTCLVTMLNYGHDVIFNEASRRDLNSIC